MGGHRHERPRVPLSDQPAAARAGSVPVRVRAGALALLRTAKPRRPVRLDPIPDQYLPARGLAAPHPEHVDALDLRPRRRRSARTGSIHAVLSVLWCGGWTGSCAGEPRLSRSRAWRIGGHRGRDRLLRTHVSGGSAGGDRADSVHSPLLRSARGHFRDDLVLHAGRSRFPIARQRYGHGRGCLVGAYRRVSRRLACNATPAKARRRLSPLLSRRGHLWLSAGWPTGRRTGSMDIMQLFWLFFIISALQPVLQRRYLEAMRTRKIANIEKKRASRVILLIHRQETMNLLGFPLMRYIDVNDSEEVLRAI